jgi:phosphatidylinositol kinase/protein kinase (PI-3  family)
MKNKNDWSHFIQNLALNEFKVKLIMRKNKKLKLIMQKIKKLCKKIRNLSESFGGYIYNIHFKPHFPEICRRAVQ